ncbi:hypothetical protein VC83_07573 [Pseudogymnoascus destructans]|uniref:AAA+ ATPase domain-containing protein n=1 Tax=Pseudogymnoascus destructans TaxID=655981 RepID=A0A177A349_9PEZI|nr:uncharacterized protein VC83_07573 [Pseudogymnoascus destructans]OAF55513.1 hypothetical protein VC83_07573 [Pseudogymnoascus destructans]
MSDEDASEILTAMKMHPTSPNPHCYRSELLPFAQQFIDVVKSLSATQSTPAALAAADEVKAEDPPERIQTYKTVNEVWDEKAYKYVIEEQHQPEEKVTVKKTEIPVVYIDIKSKLLRDTWRVILAQAPGISLNEESLSLERNILFHYLPDLEASRKWNRVDPQDSIIREHIALLIDHINLSYKETKIDESAMKSSMDLDALTDEDFLICSPTVLGFSLNDKLWLEFAVADISEISWNESLFNQVAIPSRSKKLIEALTTFQSGGKAKYTFDDFVEGKGRGLIMLLYGPPGVGKTMTAEGLSEHLKRPLHSKHFHINLAQVSAGKLSNDAKHLEVQLCGMFEVAENWKALLLLDEADDFLCRRSYDSNTTLSSRDFDEAVQSRIHIGVKYSPLGVDTRKAIWRSFLGKAKTENGDAAYSDKQLNVLAKHSLNGRQASIKNAVRSAHAIASSDGTHLCYSHLETVLEVGKEFENDFRGSGEMANMLSYA